jgi:hypothetical protein
MIKNPHTINRAIARKLLKECAKKRSISQSDKSAITCRLQHKAAAGSIQLSCDAIEASTLKEAIQQQKHRQTEQKQKTYL